MPELPITEPSVTLIEEPDGSLDALEAAKSSGEISSVAARWPECLSAWAALGERALADESPVQAYAYFRVGYHRGLDRIRAAGWRGSGRVPWSHAGNRGFLPRRRSARTTKPAAARSSSRTSRPTLPEVVSAAPVTDASPAISSTNNPLVKRVRALRRRKERHREKTFFVDGIQPVWQALDRSAPVERLVVAPELLTSDATRRRIDEARAAGVEVTTVTADVYRALSERDGPAGVGALVALAERPLKDVRVDATTVAVAADQISNPGNLGTIVRTTDGAGAGPVVVVGDAADPFDPVAVKASMGTIFSVDVCRAGSLDDLFAWARATGLAVVTTSARAATPYYDAPYRLPALLVLGSEGEGLPEEALARGDVQVRIDMRGAASSLNVAVAAGILLFELRRATSR